MKRLLIPIAAMMAITAMVAMVAASITPLDQVATNEATFTAMKTTVAAPEVMMAKQDISMAASQVQANAATLKADDSGANTLICPMNAAATKVEQANLMKATPATEVLRVICMRAASTQIRKS